MRDCGSLADYIWGKHADLLHSGLSPELRDRSAFPAREQKEGSCPSECINSISYDLFSRLRVSIHLTAAANTLSEPEHVQMVRAVHG